MLACGLLLVLVVVFLQTPWGCSLLTRGLSRGLSRGGRTVELRGLSGLVPLDARLESLTLGDQEGEWLRVEQLGWHIRLAPLLHRHVHVRRAWAERVHLRRLPFTDLPTRAPRDPGVPRVPPPVTLDAIHVGDLSAQLPGASLSGRLTAAHTSRWLLDAHLALDVSDATGLARLAGYEGAGQGHLQADFSHAGAVQRAVASLSLQHARAAGLVIANVEARLDLKDLYGLDLVRLQFAVARGEALSLSQDDVTLSGHALECRLYAEDAAAGFVPSPGTLSAFLPPDGPGVRCDSGVEAGDEISIHYDPMIAKLLTWGRDRSEAIARMQRALSEFEVSGVKTSVPFHLHLLAEPAFVEGAVHVNHVDEEFDGATDLADETPDEELGLQVSLAALDDLLRGRRRALRPSGPLSAWAEAGRLAMKGRR